MPHFVIDYSQDVETRYDIDKVMQIAFDTGVASGVMQAVDIKVRARCFAHHRTAHPGDSFLHVAVFLLDGRTDDQKQTISLLLRENLVAYLDQVTSVSVDIRDMNRVAYKKRVLPPNEPT